MAEILKDTEQRLVIALGTRSRRWTKFVFDKEAGRAWFERHRPIWSEQTTEVALADIAAIDAAQAPTLGKRAPSVVVTLKSGNDIWLAGEDGAEDAIARMRDFADIGESQTRPSASFAGHWLRPIGLSVLALAVLALLWVGVSKSINLFVLPGCDAPRTRDEARNQLQSKAKGTIALSDFLTISRERGEQRCQARITIDGDSATVGYRSYWDGWSPKVRITGAIGTARLEPTRMMAIDQAYDTFMALARDTYRSGNPPRQYESPIYTLLTTIFEVSGLPARTLAGSDIDEAIRWFNSGDTVGSVYVLAGTGVTDFAKLPADDATQRQLRNNVVSFSDEYGRYMDFQVTLLGVIADAQASHAASGPRAEVDNADFKAKVAAIKPLFVQALKSDLISLVYEGLSDNWRLDRLTALARIAPIAARVLSREDAQSIRDQALQTLPYFKTDAVKTRVADVARMIAPR